MSYTAENTSRMVKAGNVNVHYHDAGKGFPVVLVHGGGPGATGWSNYSKNVDMLAQHWRVLIVDLPGFGKSDRNIPGDKLFGYYAKVMRDFLEALDIPKAHFIGNSLGGGTSLKTALDYPDRVASLILMGSGGGLPIFSAQPTEGVRKLGAFYVGTGPSEQKLRAFLEMLVYDSSVLTKELVAQRYATATLPENVANPPLKFKAGHPPIEDLWREAVNELPHEVLLITGREDRVVPLDSSFILLKLIPNARLHVLPKCGHWAQWEKADEFNTMVHNFMHQAM